MKYRSPPSARLAVWLVPYAAAAVGGGLIVWLVLWLAWSSGTEVATPTGLDPLSTPARDYGWAEQPPPAFPLPPYARYLEGVTIVLDPGHGGRADRANWKRGPTGLREAEVNLRVAQSLRDFLSAAGAKVVLTREADVFLDKDDGLDLQRRAAVANELRADLFLSIHHNAAARSEANYTAIFYHDSVDHSPASLCAARHLLTGLNDALRLEQHLPCALLNDTLVAKRNGFAVLRLANGPAVLSEASFHSNPEEERRLRDPVYNRREAYGLFLGLARWAQAGLPRVALIAPRNGRVQPGEQVVVALDDGISKRGGWGEETVKILRDSIIVKLDGEWLSAEVAMETGQVLIALPAELSRGAHRLFVDFETIFGQHVLHPHLEIRR